MTTYYISVDGDNNGNGTAESPWRTISKAMWKIQAGDEVVVGSGTYNELVRISASGTADNYITVRSAVPGGAKIVSPSDYGVHIQGDYIKLDGFDVSGASKSGITTNLAHHIVITNNTSHDNGMHGISASLSDYVTIDGNVTYNNASAGPYSGISIYHPQAAVGDTGDNGYRNIITDNISYNNVTKTDAHSDGNGIILDDFRSTKDTSRDPYLYPTLVENNIVYGNGGKGIQVAWSDYATIRGNTAWHNNTDPLATGGWKGDLSNMNSSHNTWVNNIAVANNDSTVKTAIDNTSFTGYVNSDNVWANNLTYNGTAGDASTRNTGNVAPSIEGGNLLGVNPMLVDPEHGDFRLSAYSPAVDNGTKAYGYAPSDLFGNLRAGVLDIGAHEVGSSDPNGHNYMLGSAADDQFYGYKGNDTLLGFGGNDTLVGGEGVDSLLGGDGADFVNGGKDNDIVVGGGGQDQLQGGLGADTFAFRAPTDTGLNALADVITDFSHADGDKIDLSGIDANTKAYGNNAFTFIGTANFTKVGGQVRVVDGYVYADVNGDKIADFHIAVHDALTLVAGDFIL